MSLFNRPAWAKSQSTTNEAEDSAGNIFSHSSRSYREIVAEQERKKQAKSERKKLKKERRRSDRQDISVDSGEAGSSKRRRISLEDDDEVEVGAHDVKRTPKRSAAVEEIAYNTRSSRKDTPKRSPLKNRSVDVLASPTRGRGNKDAEVVDLEDSGGEEDVEITAVKTSATEVVDEESDDEFAELARRAREERLRKQQQQPGKNSHTPDSQGPSSTHDPNAANRGQTSLPTPPPDPSIALFITSRLPDTNPMIVYRRLSQNIADVRKAWCQRQGLSEQAAKQIFFIHGMRRVYDVTTCRSLGLEVDSLGNVVLTGAEGKEDVEKVHLEAVNDEIFQQIKEEKAQASRKDDADSNTAAGAEDDLAETQQEESYIRLLLKAKDREDFRLKVKPTTTFAKIATAYAKTQGLSPNQSVYLAFDGERLDPDEEMRNTEIADWDCIEVHISSS